MNKKRFTIAGVSIWSGLLLLLVILKLVRWINASWFWVFMPLGGLGLLVIVIYGLVAFLQWIERKLAARHAPPNVQVATCDECGQPIPPDGPFRAEYPGTYCSAGCLIKHAKAQAIALNQTVNALNDCPTLNDVMPKENQA